MIEYRIIYFNFISISIGIIEIINPKNILHSEKRNIILENKDQTQAMGGKRNKREWGRDSCGACRLIVDKRIWSTFLAQ